SAEPLSGTGCERRAMWRNMSAAACAGRGIFRRNPTAEEEFMGSVSKHRTRTRWFASVIAILATAAASAQTGQTGTPTGPQTEKPQAPETAPAKPPSASPVPAFVSLGPSREVKLGENTWFRFGAQVQAWAREAQDRILQPGGGEGGYAFDFYCRRCRLFTTGSVVKDVY